MGRAVGRTIFKYLGLVVLLHGLCLAGVAAATETTADFDKQVRAWDGAIERTAKRLQSGRTGSLEERDLRGRLQDIANTAAEMRDAARIQAKLTKGLIEALGPQSEASLKLETVAIQKRHKELGGALAIYEGRAKQAVLIIAKTEQTLSAIGQRSRERLKKALFERTVTPLNHKAWTVAAPEAVRLFEASFIESPVAWWAGIRGSPIEQDVLLHNLLLALAAAVASWLLGRWMRSRYGRVQGIDEPSYGRRLLAGLAEGGCRAIAPIIFALLVGALFVDGELVDGRLATVVEAAVGNLVLFFLGYALINAALTPRRLQWRLLDFGEEASRLLVRRLKLTLTVFLVLDGLHRAASWATPSAELESVAGLVFTLCLTPLLISLLSLRIWSGGSPDQTPESEPAASNPARLRAFITLALAALPFAAGLGYPGLATYLTRAVVMSGLILGGLGLLRSVGRETLAAVLDSSQPVGRRIGDAFALSREAGERLLFWLHVCLDFGLLIVAGLALLPVWGFGAEESAASAAKLMRGVQIGSYTLSLVDVLLGFFMFAIIVFLTRLVQRGLERHILPNLSRDKGVRDALKTGVGYIGFVIATLVAISAMGLNLTNLALIAGALSVGLGFGLQNVVNNFVSGLILLVERPIKQGDWVVISGHEGTVKNVNVRSTEIETFQRASVIIPNADLISTPVINWTHKNSLGRVEITLGVAYGTDPRLVETLLLDCAKAHPNVLAYPHPMVLFMDFGDSSLDFELRAYLANVEKRLQTGSELRFALHDTLKEKGIEIPFPQRVLHFSSAPPEVPSPENEKT